MPDRSSTLVVTKLLAPRPRAGYVVRPRLMRLLVGGPDCRLTLVSAPPGFGKTSLVAGWVGESGAERDVGWVSLDAGDDDPTIFWRYVLAAVRRFGESVGADARAILDAAQPSIEAVVAHLINDLAALPDGRERFLVLDDYHLITQPRIHETVGYFVDRLPPGLRLVIATRADPPLPLARLRVRGMLAEVRSADLRFTDDEAGEFVARLTGTPLPAGVVESLAARTEGWAAGLQLAALALQSGSPSERSPLPSGVGTAQTERNDRYVFDYLAEEVLARLPDRDRDFLLRTSILEALNAPLCDAVTGRADGAATLRRLEAANLFLVPLDPAREWYRYHGLFAAFLRAQLEAERDPSEVVALHRRASDWFAEEGHVRYAIEHALQGGDESHAADLLAGQVQALFRRNELGTIVALSRRLSPGSLDARPSLGIGSAWALLATGRPDEVESRLASVERHFGIVGRSVADADFADLPAGSRDAAVEVATVRLSLALNRWDLPQIMQITAALLPHLADESRMLVFGPVGSVKPVVHFDMGIAHEFGGRLDVAADAFAESVRASRGENNPHITALALSHLAAAQFARGEIDAAIATYAEARSAARAITGSRSPLSAIAEAGLGLVLYERGDLDAAERLFGEAVALGREWRNVESLAMSHLGLARVHRARGDLAAAGAALRELVEGCEGVARDAHLPAVRAAEARLALDRGDLAAASRWADALSLPPDPADALLRAGEYATLARVRIAAGRAADAEVSLPRLVAAAEATGRTGVAVEALVLLALAWRASSGLGRALDALGRALALAAPGGYRRVFLDEGPVLRDLLREAARRGVAREYVAVLLAGEPTSELARAVTPDGPAAEAPRPSVPAAHLAEPLTEREREVLRLVVAGRSNAEIADALVVSVGTVKTHTHNLYVKLGVTTRAAAIARARALGIG